MNKNSDSSDRYVDYLCPACRAEGMFVFHEQKDVPVHSVMNMPDRKTAIEYPVGDIMLGFCKQCGFISNIAFNPKLIEYSSDCEESQGFSPTFNAFAHNLAKELIKRYNLYNKDIIEIGCGKGEFIISLCEIGKNRGVGFDPAFVPERITSEAKKRVTFIRDYYSEKYSRYKADFICCKMTLEHIWRPLDFIETLRRSIGDKSDTIVFFQLPDATRILRDCAFEDIYYEHCSYFCPESLTNLFHSCNFDILNSENVFDEQYIIMESKPSTRDNLSSLNDTKDIEVINDNVLSFEKKYESKIEHWNIRFQGLIDNNKRVVIWGSGSKGVAFLSTFKKFNIINYVVDINPYRQGTYMAGTGQEIVGPEFLREYKPDVVIVMNSIYVEEIRHDLNAMGLNPEILAL